MGGDDEGNRELRGKHAVLPARIVLFLLKYRNHRKTKIKETDRIRNEKTLLVHRFRRNEKRGGRTRAPKDDQGHDAVHKQRTAIEGDQLV